MNSIHVERDDSFQKISWWTQLERHFVREREAAMLSVYNQSYLAISIGEEVRIGPDTFRFRFPSWVCTNVVSLLQQLFRCVKSVCTSLAPILSPGLTLSCSSQDLALSACRWKQLLLRRQLDKDKDNTGSRQSGASTQPIRGTQSHLWPSACCKGTSSGGEYQLKHPNKDLHTMTFSLSLMDLWVYLQF